MMKSIAVRFKDPVLTDLVREQLQKNKNWTLQDDITHSDLDLIISDEMAHHDIPHLILGPKVSQLPEHSEHINLPTRLGEMTDRIKYILSRRQRFAGSEEDLIIGPYTLHTISGHLTHNITHKSARLTDKEKLILVCLATAKHKKIDRKLLMEHVWGYAENAETHTLETHLYRLRQKIEDIFADDQFIVTENGFYFLNLLR